MVQVAVKRKQTNRFENSSGSGESAQDDNRLAPGFILKQMATVDVCSETELNSKHRVRVLGTSIASRIVLPWSNQGGSVAFRTGRGSMRFVGPSREKMNDG